jgi:phosphate transport system protein
VLLSGDPAEAGKIRHDDDAVDELHRHLFTVLMDREW